MHLKLICFDLLLFINTSLSCFPNLEIHERLLIASINPMVWADMTVGQVPLVWGHIGCWWQGTRDMLFFLSLAADLFNIQPKPSSLSDSTLLSGWTLPCPHINMSFALGLRSCYFFFQKNSPHHIFFKILLLLEVQPKCYFFHSSPVTSATPYGLCLSSKTIFKVFCLSNLPDIEFLLSQILDHMVLFLPSSWATKRWDGDNSGMNFGMGNQNTNTAKRKGRLEVFLH